MNQVALVQFSPADLFGWSAFCKEMRRQRRVCRSKNSQALLDGITEVVKKKYHIKLRKGRFLYRNQSNMKAGKKLDPKDMGLPPASKATAGRINPKGIPYLYLSNSFKTAILESRGWTGRRLTVGKARITKDLLVADFTQILEEPQDAIQFTYQELVCSAFYLPNNEQNESFYLPSQVISEQFKMHGFSGLKYRSSMNPNGFNVALFDSAGIQFVETTGVRIKQLDVKYARF